jgi:hypothetical protein
MTAQKTLAYMFAPTNATYVGDSSGSVLAPNAVVSVLAGNVNDYVLAWGCTNSTFTTVQGTTVNYEFYCREGDNGDQTYKLEIYRRDLATDVLSEWGDGGPTFTVPTTATPTLVSGSVYVPSIATNAFRIWARLKRIGGNATSVRTLNVGTGAGTPTFFSMTIPASVAIDAHDVSPTAHDNRWTPAGIAAAGGVVASTILQPGEFDLGTVTTVSIATNFVCFTANVTSTWTLAISASTPRYPRDLIIIGTNGSIIPSYVTDLRTGSAAATNLIYVRPYGSLTNWYIK